MWLAGIYFCRIFNISTNCVKMMTFSPPSMISFSLSERRLHFPLKLGFSSGELPSWPRE